jgi:hypothetical protein
MMMGKIYRIENYSKVGPYRTESNGQLDGTITYRHPSYRSDSKLMRRAINKTSIFYVYHGLELNRDTSRFAFSSIAQLRFWFHNDDDLIHLNKFRFRVVVYEVPTKHCIRGNTQCIYNKQHATKIETISLLKFLSKKA